MFKSMLVAAVFLGTTGMAAEQTVDVRNIGLRLSKSAESTLGKYGKQVGEDFKLVSRSTTVESLVTSGEDLKKIHVTFSIEKKVEGKKTVYQYCEADLIPEEQESDPSDVILKLANAGCHH